MLRRLALVTTDASEECIAPISLLRLLATAVVVPSSLIRSTVIVEDIRFSEKSVLTRATWRHIPEDGIHHGHRRGSLKSYIASLC
jgi:hypothetical protein